MADGKLSELIAARDSANTVGDLQSLGQHIRAASNVSARPLAALLHLGNRATFKFPAWIRPVRPHTPVALEHTAPRRAVDLGHVLPPPQLQLSTCGPAAAIGLYCFSI